jgi:hypothetical protein
MQHFLPELEADDEFCRAKILSAELNWERRNVYPSAEVRVLAQRYTERCRRQRMLLSGLDCCPGQQDLIFTDGDSTDERCND